MLIQRTSPISGVTTVRDIDVTSEQLDAYFNRSMLDHFAFPCLQQDDIEFIKTGVTPAEWHTVFGKF